MKPKLSICIPTYNRAKFLGATLRSIVDQVGEDVEIVVSDNASNDETSDIVEFYRKLHPALVYFRQPENVGADRNYLKVVELASGEYCWLFGSDDILKKDAIQKVLQEIKLKFDVYLCGLTLCSFDMKPLVDHRILKINSDAVFDLSNTQERQAYCELAETTTAFFSFIGSLIIKKTKWVTVAIDEEKFIGSLWSHVAKIFGMIPYGLKLKYLHESLLYKRGDNDSFLDKGMAHRIGISVYGYQMIGDWFFGAHSIESRHIRRVLKFEWPLIAFISLKRENMANKKEEPQLLNNVFKKCYSGSNLADRFARLIFGSNLLGSLYNMLHFTGRFAKGFAKR